MTIMFTITILAFGSINEFYLLSGIAEYSKRLSRFVNLNIMELAEQATPVDASPTQIQANLSADAKKVLLAIPKQAYVVSLDRRGKTWTSEGWSQNLESLKLRTSHLVLLIGGSHGLHESLDSVIKEKWSFSTLTFPHQLFRLMLLEQLYRAWMIAEGKPYHK
jgi:23S rRNA (pseudouridine1915-N3)-methyltransferase